MREHNGFLRWAEGNLDVVRRLLSLHLVSFSPRPILFLMRAELSITTDASAQY